MHKLSLVNIEHLCACTAFGVSRRRLANAGTRHVGVGLRRAGHLGFTFECTHSLWLMLSHPHNLFVRVCDVGLNKLVAKHVLTRVLVSCRRRLAMDAHTYTYETIRFQSAQFRARFRNSTFQVRAMRWQIPNYAYECSEFSSGYAVYIYILCLYVYRLRCWHRMRVVSGAHKLFENRSSGRLRLREKCWCVICKVIVARSVRKTNLRTRCASFWGFKVQNGMEYVFAVGVVPFTLHGFVDFVSLSLSTYNRFFGIAITNVRAGPNAT